MSEHADAAGYDLIVSFPDPSPTFVHGFEAGMLWQMMQSGAVAEIDRSTHAENREIIARMAVAAGWTVDVTPTDIDGWDRTVLAKVAPAPVRPNPHGLRLVQQASGDPK